MKISNASWHYRLIKKFDCMPWIRNNEIDLCSYGRAFLKACLLTVFLPFIAALVTAAFGDFFAWLSAGIVETFAEPRFGAQLICAMFGAVALIGVCGYIGYVWNKNTEQPASAIRLAYARVTSRFCVILKIE